MTPIGALPPAHIAAALAAFTPRDDVKHLMAQVDASAISAAARRHGVHHLVARGTQHLGLPSPAGPVIEEETRWQLHRLSAMVRVQTLLADAGIESLPYKGPAVAARIYGGLGLRPFSDIDLLLDRKVAIPARHVLLDAGFTPETAFTAAEEAAFVREGCEFNFRSPDSNIPVEIHWAIVPRFFALDLDAAQFFRDPQILTIAGRTVRAPNDRELLLALFAHGTKHAWAGLKWIADIAWFVEREEGFDWDGLVREAGLLRMRRMVATGLYLAQRLFAVRLPDETSRIVRNDPVARRLGDAIVGMIGKGINAQDRLPWTQWFWTRVREHPADQVRVATRVISEPTVLFRRRTGLGPRFDSINRPLRILHVVGRGLRRTARQHLSKKT